MEKRDRGTTVNLSGEMLRAIEEEVRQHPELWRSRTVWVHQAIREKLERDRAARTHHGHSKPP